MRSCWWWKFRTAAAAPAAAAAGAGVFASKGAAGDGRREQICVVSCSSGLANTCFLRINCLLTIDWTLLGR
jgi:hypothetical protein